MGKSSKISTDNIFETLGFNTIEARILKQKSALLMQIETEIDQRDMSISAAANELSVSRSKLSKVLRGIDVGSVSLDWLFTVLAKLGQNANIVVAKANPRTPPISIAKARRTGSAG